LVIGSETELAFVVCVKLIFTLAFPGLAERLVGAGCALLIGVNVTALLAAEYNPLYDCNLMEYSVIINPVILQDELVKVKFVLIKDPPLIE